MKREVIKFAAWAVVAIVAGLIGAYQYVRTLEEGTSNRWTYTMELVSDMAARLAACENTAPPTPQDVVRLLRHPDDE